MKDPAAELIFLLVARPAVRSAVAHFAAEQPVARCSAAHVAAEQPAVRCSAAHFAAEQPAADCLLASKQATPPAPYLPVDAARCCANPFQATKAVADFLDVRSARQR